ncbi:PEPM [Symbiodinium sp. CCMP2592]|nr:PEPM [Symbiodinium sp. CCMP2592]
MMGIMPPECTKMLEVLKGYAKENRPQTHLPEQEECRRQQLARNWHCWTPALWAALIPRRLLGMLAVSSFFVFKYYVEHCVHLDDGSWVSKPLRLPKESSLSILSFVFGPLPMLFPIDAEDQPIWEMPVALLALGQFEAQGGPGRCLLCPPRGPTKWMIATDRDHGPCMGRPMGPPWAHDGPWQCTKTPLIRITTFGEVSRPREAEAGSGHQMSK